MADAERSSIDSVDALIARLLERPALATDVLGRWLAQQPSQVGKLMTRLKDESERMLVIDMASAEVLANALVWAAEQLDEPRFKALGGIALGDVRRAQGRYADAIDVLDAAGQAFLTLGDEIGWARTRTGWVFASQFTGRGREAVSVAEHAYAILAGAGEHLRAGALSTNVAGVHYQLGDYEQALTLYDRAICHFRKVAPVPVDVTEERIAKAMANKALALMLLGHFAEAIELCESAREIFVRCGEMASALRVDHFRSSIYAGQGQYTRALRVQVDALAAFERAGLDESAVQVTLDLIDSQAGLNRHIDALALADDLADRCEAAGASTEAAKARLRLARAHAALGNNQAALEALESATKVFSTTGLAVELGAVTLLRARLHLDEEDWEEADALSGQAFDLFAERGLVERRTQAELVRARAALALGEHTAASELAESALAASRSLDALPLSHAAHHVLARVAETRRQTARALEEYEAAIGDLEQVQSSLATELRTEFLGDKLRLFHDAIDLCIAENQLARGLDYLERAKSRALVAYLESQPELRLSARSDAERDLIDELTRLREEHHWFYSRLHGTGPATESDALPEPERQKLHEGAATRERQIRRLQERLALFRDSEGLESPAPRRMVESPELPRVEDGTVLVEYAFRDDRGAVFVVSGSGVTVKPLAIGTRGLQRLLNLWYLNVESSARANRHHEALDHLTRNATGVLAKMYQALVAPLSEDLADARRLIVVPYGPAHGVPFHALFDGHRYLIDRMEVVTTPSNNLLKLCAQRARSKLESALVIGYSGGNLPGVLDEAQRVACLLGGTCYLEADATRKVVVGEAPRADILHLAAHGEARLDNPTFAHVALADGQLGMADILTIRLDGALVTLSACETGRSAVVGGDELIGLSRGFLFAGASTLVQSLWRVDDLATTVLMEDFYTALGRALSPAGALRKVQRASIDAGAPPYVWAPFQVVGHGG